VLKRTLQTCRGLRSAVFQVVTKSVVGRYNNAKRLVEPSVEAVSSEEQMELVADCLKSRRITTNNC